MYHSFSKQIKRPTCGCSLCVFPTFARANSTYSFRGSLTTYMVDGGSCCFMEVKGVARVLPVFPRPSFGPCLPWLLCLHQVLNTQPSLPPSLPPPPPLFPLFRPSRPLQVLNGQMWVLIDGAILDVSNFSQRHPGGARLVLNAVGTDVTYEMLGEELSVGHAMSFSPQVHPEVNSLAL